MRLFYSCAEQLSTTLCTQVTSTLSGGHHKYDCPFSFLHLFLLPASSPPLLLLLPFFSPSNSPLSLFLSPLISRSPSLSSLPFPPLLHTPIAHPRFYNQLFSGVDEMGMLGLFLSAATNTSMCVCVFEEGGGDGGVEGCIHVSVGVGDACVYVWGKGVVLVWGGAFPPSGECAFENTTHIHT